MEVCSSCGRLYRGEQDFLSETSRWRFCEDGNLWFNCSCQNTMVILQGKFDWFSPEKVMNENTASLFNRLSKKNKIPYIPGSIMQIQILLSDENSCARDFADAVKSDPVLAAEILSRANNMKLGSQQNINSLAFAFSYIGRTAISEIAMLAGIKSFRFNTRRFLSQDFWAEAMKTGIVTEFLAGRLQTDVTADEAYLTGSLCNMGKIINALLHPRETDEMYLRVKKGEGSWSDLEEQGGLYGHTILGELASVIWGLPQYVADGALGHNIIPSVNRTTFSSAELAGLACNLLHKEKNEEHLCQEEFLAAAQKKARMDDEQWSELICEFVNFI